MSTSNWQNISYNIDLVKKLDPKRILDVGVVDGGSVKGDVAQIHCGHCVLLAPLQRSV